MFDLLSDCDAGESGDIEALRDIAVELMVTVLYATEHDVPSEASWTTLFSATCGGAISGAELKWRKLKS